MGASSIRWPEEVPHRRGFPRAEQAQQLHGQRIEEAPRTLHQIQGCHHTQRIHIRHGHPDHPFIMTVGCVAGDEETYEVFKDFYDIVIDERHGGYGPDGKHQTDLNFEGLTGDVNFDEKYVKSSRVRTGRSIRGIAMPPFRSRGERRKVETIAKDVLAGLTGEFKGTSSPLAPMTEKDQAQLIADHFLFDKPVY